MRRVRGRVIATDQNFDEQLDRAFGRCSPPSIASSIRGGSSVANEPRVVRTIVVVRRPSARRLDKAMLTRGLRETRRFVGARSSGTDSVNDDDNDDNGGGPTRERKSTWS